MMSRNFYIILLFLFCYKTVNCQEPIIYNKYFSNHKMLINPAFTGNPNEMNIVAGIQREWIGIKNAPNNQVISWSFLPGKYDFYDPEMYINKTKFNFSQRVGLGLSLFNDANGPVSVSGSMFSFAYHLPLNNAILSMGLSGILTQHRYNLSNMHPLNADDPAITNGDDNFVNFDANVGFEYYTEKYYAGFSACELFKSKIHQNEIDKNKTDYFVSGGYVFTLGNGFKLLPGVVCKKINSENPEFEIHTQLKHNSNYWLGATYAVKRYAGLDFGILIYRSLYLAYDFELPVTKFYGYSAGNHQISLFIDFKGK
jgi:type IX secretion system PorP/SprF family membrane protein